MIDATGLSRIVDDYIRKELFKMCQTRRTSSRNGFTLIELLLVLVILAILAAIVIPKFTGTTERAKEIAAADEIPTLKGMLSRYEIDTGTYPTTDQGLQALVTQPSNVTGWKGKYTDKISVDPWGTPYVYRSPGNNGDDYDLISCGPDKREGTSDDIK